MKKVVILENIGLKPYREALLYQEDLHKKRAEGKIDDTVIFCEHPPVYTIGKRDSSDDFLSDLKVIAGDGIDVVKADRGGKITYHGPGQLVAYFIFNIAERKLGVKEYVHKIEDVCMKALEKFGINAVRDKEHPGLWVNDKKIVAIGLNISKNVSMHGIALNVDPNMEHYRHIVPCGIRDRGVTSMKEVLDAAPPLDDVIKTLGNAVLKLF